MSLIQEIQEKEQLNIYHLETRRFNDGTLNYPPFTSIIFLKHHIYTSKCDVLKR